MRTEEKEPGTLVGKAEQNSKKERKFDLCFAEWVRDRKWGIWDRGNCVKASKIGDFEG